MKSIGHLSQYALADRDNTGQYLDGSKSYKLHLPPNIPANNFWSLLVYDPQTRSMLQTDQRFSSISSLRKDISINPDSSVDVYFGPKPPAGKESNWIMTVPGKGWWLTLRLYGVLEPWFDKTWKPGEVELLEGPTETVNKLVKYKMTTDIPPSITTPDSVETSLGTLRFFDGFPDAETARKVFDNLDFQRGMQVFLNALQASGMYATRAGYRTFGPDNQTVLISDSFLDSRTLYLLANTETIYLTFWANTKEGPLVIEVPPDVLGFIDDFWSRFVTDMGRAGRDKGKGGKYLLLPPGYNGEVADPPTMGFIDMSGKYFNCIPSNDMSFYEEINQVVQEEPLEATDPEIRGLLASIGIQKGKPFAPDDRMKSILTDAVNVGNATARAITFNTRDQEAFIYPGSRWQLGYIGNDHEFSPDGVLNLDARTFFYYNATGITPAMSAKMVGIGSQYAFNGRDANGKSLDGSKNYRLHIPPNMPAKDFWSVCLYDPQTRSLLQTDQRYPTISSQKEGIMVNADTSVDVYFGPEPPEGKEANWIQTIPGKGWFTLLRLYGPLEPWFDKTWQPGEITQLGITGGDDHAEGEVK